MKCTFYRWLFTLMLSTGMHNCNYGVGIDTSGWPIQPPFATCRLMDDQLARLAPALALDADESPQLASVQNVVAPVIGQPPSPEPMIASSAHVDYLTAEEYFPYDRLESVVSQDSSPTPNLRQSFWIYVSEGWFGSRSKDYVSLPDSSLLADGRRPPIDFQRERSTRELELNYDSFRLDESEWRCTPSYSNRPGDDFPQEQPSKVRSRPADLDQEQLERWKKLWTEVVEAWDQAQQTMECYPPSLLAGNQIAQWSKVFSKHAHQFAQWSASWMDQLEPVPVFENRPMSIYTFGNGIAIVTPSFKSFEIEDAYHPSEPQACFPIVTSTVPAEEDSNNGENISEAALSRTAEADPPAFADSSVIAESQSDFGSTLIEAIANSLHRSGDWLKDVANRLEDYAGGRIANRHSNHR